VVGAVFQLLRCEGVAGGDVDMSRTPVGTPPWCGVVAGEESVMLFFLMQFALLDSILYRLVLQIFYY